MPVRRPVSKPRSRDGLLAVAILIIEAFAATRDLSASPGLSGLTELPILVWAILSVGSGALVLRRRHPLRVLSVVVVAYATWHLLGYAGGPSLAVLVAMYGLGRYVPGIRTSLIALTAATGAIVATGIRDGDAMADLAIAAFAVPLLPWYIGRRVAARHAHLQLLEDRAASIERERAAELRQVLDEERRMIARELHDVVAHRVSLITVQAGAAQAVMDSDPARAAQAMSAVEDAGRAALDELRHLLDVLEPRSADKPRSPTASLADLRRVAEQMEAAGLAVSLDVDDLPANLPTRVELSAFRIVQESLTNVLRHAGPGTRAMVKLSIEGNELRVEVTDNGTGTGPQVGGRTGRGIAGMRERAQLLGGRFEAGPDDQGGFRVRAILPVTGPRP